MFKKTEGFTLVEILIVVAIIAILATLLISKAPIGIQQAKQTGTMSDMRVISDAITNYFTTYDTLPAQNGIYAPNSSFYLAVLTRYIENPPVSDQWGNEFRVYIGSAIVGNYGISQADDIDYLVASLGRDGIEDGFAYDPINPIAGWFQVSKMDDYKNDLVMRNGAWIHGPARAKRGK